MAKSNANLYSYRFDWDEQRDGPLGDYSLFLGAAHGLEIPFIAQTFNMEQIPWYVRPILFPDSSAAGRNSLSEQLMTFGQILRSMETQMHLENKKIGRNSLLIANHI